MPVRTATKTKRRTTSKSGKRRSASSTRARSSSPKRAQSARPKAAAQKRTSGRQALVLVGTMKGAFIFRADESRKKWTVDGPHFRGEAVYAMLHDTRGGRSRTYAAATSMHWGPTLRISDDLGVTWSSPERQAVRFPEDSGRALAQIWQIAAGRASEPNVLYCGVEPAALFESRDGGETWQPNKGLLNHEHQPKWQPGGGGLCLHTIVLDPTNTRRMLIAMSTGGVYRTDDGGKTWRARNAGVRAQFMPPEQRYPEFGQCVHKVVQHPDRPGRLFLQNHWGLYRSDDWGDSWHDIANGVPSDFGFAMQMHPHDPDTVYIVPIEADMFRATPEAKLRVYRTRNAGQSWEPLTRGLPQSDAYENVLRDALSADSFDSAGIYFGTRSGKLFGSRDSGASWTEMADGLPPIVCVKTGMTGSA
ncbi:MAG TPA: exo-alpha-sialidase [Gemmatimonadaceae bacterium]|nr:exo-alpha-sialidase [Gemmatimonadaceae bacterium]